MQYLYLLNKYIKCNAKRLAVRYDPVYGSLGVKGLKPHFKQGSKFLPMNAGGIHEKLYFCLLVG